MVNLKKFLKIVQEKNIVCLFFITLLGTFIRIFGAGKRDLWFDEAISYFLAKQNVTTLLSVSFFDNSPPLYHLLLKSFIFFGKSEFTLRFPSLIFGILSIPLSYFIAFKISFQGKIALLTSTFISFSPLLVYYSQETRPYSLLTFLFLLMLHFFFSFLEKNSRLDRLLLFFLTFLALYTSYFSFYFLVILNTLFFIKLKVNRDKLSDWIFIQISILIASLPAFLFYFLLPHSTPWALVLEEKIITPFASQAVSGIGVFTLRSLFFSPTPFASKILAGVLIFILNFLFLLGISSCWKKKQNLIVYPLIGFVAPFFLSLIFSFWKPLFSPRLFIPLSFFFYFGASLGIYFLTTKVNKYLKPSILTFILLPLLFYSVLQNTNALFWGEPLQKASTFLSQKTKDEEIIAHSSIFTFYSFSYYQETLSQYLVLPNQLSSVLTQEIGSKVFPLSKLSSKNKNHLWFVNLTHYVDPQDEKKALQYFADNFKLSEKWNFGNIEIYKWQKDDI